MRPSTVTPTFVLLSIVLLAGGSLAHLGGADLDDEQGQASLAGYVPPVVALASGDAVRWTSLDVVHTFTEGSPGVSPALPRCFNVAFGSTARGASFELGTDGNGAPALFATATGTTDPVACSSAVVAGRVAVQPFYCTIHPWMNGVLVVYDATTTTQTEAMLDPVVLLLQGSLRGSVA